MDISGPLVDGSGPLVDGSGPLVDGSGPSFCPFAPEGLVLIVNRRTCGRDCGKVSGPRLSHFRRPGGLKK